MSVQIHYDEKLKKYYLLVKEGKKMVRKEVDMDAGFLTDS